MPGLNIKCYLSYFVTLAKVPDRTANVQLLTSATVLRLYGTKVQCQVQTSLTVNVLFKTTVECVPEGVIPVM